MVSAALEAAKLRRAKAEQLAGLASPASDRVGLKRKTSKNGGTPATPATTVPSSEKVTPDPKHSRTDAVEPKELFAAPKEDAEQPEGGVYFLTISPYFVYIYIDHIKIYKSLPQWLPVGQKLHRGMSSMSTIPATEEEVQAAKARLCDITTCTIKCKEIHTYVLNTLPVSWLFHHYHNLVTPPGWVFQLMLLSYI